MAIGEAAKLKLGKATRDVIGTALKELGSEFPNVVTVDKATRAKLEHVDPVYICCGRIELLEIYNTDSPLKLGKRKYGLTAEAIVAAVNKVRGR